jgi:sulfite dehydrogenase (quinone) subunit SoeC
MHPAPSIILFTVLSGAGFGLLVFLGLGLPAASGWAAVLWYGLAFALAGGGLIASTFHLGHPERALLVRSGNGARPGYRARRCWPARRWRSWACMACWP